MKIGTLETERLYLRSFNKSDAEFAIGIWNDPVMGEYLADEAMREISEDYLREIENLADDNQCCYIYRAGLFARSSSLIYLYRLGGRAGCNRRVRRLPQGNGVGLFLCWSDIDCSIAV